ncbi:Zn-finger in ubiquitin-hydrolase (macronuclear) [Tetrahymena thermophila SB210]|uniref:Zn-finger in ubiquitin-hydrolase n=1 Tax=Tetrahymena thermophila (strain SB210) TaxID=312017 RepID=Q23RF9_TETTS|nr:Zn-finger in ubiquitin-hydrolase [Tetrahymena thermophila SB210]EAR99089.1 Zn-finger in ubiquitin-hydrolase [Tetrahymena thermophila SB210]|eukprot:XP_001019334.1 Zn-finger in ubiquitin-hydrolase [Tetrahymena thermophila SB210]
MHYLFIDISRECKAGKEINIHDPFFESIVGVNQIEDSNNDEKNNINVEQEIIDFQNSQNGQQKIVKTQLGSDTKKKFLKDYDLKVMKTEVFLFKDISIMQNKQVQETLKRHIVYIFALPSDFNHEGFLAKALENQYEHVQNIRILQEFNGEKQKKKSIVLYFNDKESAESFTAEYNCYTINEKNEEYMLIVSLQFITYFTQTEQLQYAMEEQQKANLIELPNCPLCIEKLESSVSGFTLSIALNLFIYDVPSRWSEAKNACNTCMERDTLQCHQCSESDLEGLWLCLICGNIGCGRYKKGHAKDHWYQSGHCLSMEVESERIWDYFDDKFVHRIMKGENRKTIIMNNFEKQMPLQESLSRQANNQDQQIGNEQEIILAREVTSSRNQQLLRNNNHMMLWDQWNGMKEAEMQENNQEKFISDRVDNAIWEYCYVISHQMEEQRKFFEKKLEDVTRKSEDVQKEKESEILELENDMKILKEKRDKIKKLREANAKKQKTISDKNKEMESDIEKLELFIKGIQNNIQHFEQKQHQLSQQSSNIQSAQDTQMIGDGQKLNNKFSSALEQEILQESQKLQLLEQQLASLYEKLQAD